MAEERGCNRSQALRAAVVEAITPEYAGAVPDEQEVLELLGLAARGGNVAAMKELRAHHREQRRPADSDGLSALDELARRRGRTA